MYFEEEFSPAERAILDRFFTNTDRPVFALINLPEVVKGALFARYSRTPKSLRRLFLDEFYEEPETGIAAIAESLEGEDSSVDLQRAEKLYERVFSGYGDDSVAQLGGAHLACEQSSNILTKILERPKNERAFMLLPVGYPAADCEVPDLTRKGLDEVAVFDPKPEG